ncbi:MAG: hypothetical protein A3H07_04715 [Candidatus Jacksonbacteria bacterium RIFCSPLOWO2_12_FULL_44_15b]|nr:MAG: hypothetical protein A3H07_04715 [Candidatus Jacksonbacteria bacterium RIFCSPLOWO2_12_FULL_44_15b]
MWITEPFRTVSFYFLVRRLRRFGEYSSEHWRRLRKREGIFHSIIVWDFECVREARGSEGMKELRDAMRFARDLHYMNILFAANRRNDSMISKWAESAHLTKYLTEIIVRKHKRLKDAYGIVKKYNADLAASFLISSRLAPDIGFGNFLGFHTVWLQGGREPDQPFNFETRPEIILQTANDFHDLLERFARTRVAAITTQKPRLPNGSQG